MFGLTEQKLEKWGKKGKAVQLVKASSNSNSKLRLAAVKAMGNVNNENVINALIAMLRDRDPEVRIASIDSLSKINSKVAVEYIRSLISDTDEKVSQKAREALKSFAKQL